MCPIRRVLPLAVVGGALLAASTRAPGFALMGDNWPAGADVTMHLGLSRAAASFPDGSSSWNASAADALQIWNQHLQTIRFVAAGAIPSANGDGRNSVFFSSTIYGEKFGTNTIAVTVGFNDAANPSVIVETDVIFNSAERWDSYRGAQRFDSSGKPIFDLHRVALHEFGHVLGLDHPDQANQTVHALMNSRTDDNDHITDDDIAGAKHLYGLRITSSLHSVALDGGQHFSYQITANNNPTSYSAHGLPEGLRIDGGTGLISGQPTQSGTFTITVVAHGPFGEATASFQITVRGPRILSPFFPRAVQVGDEFTYQIYAERKATSFSADQLPHGLALNPATGVISGVPTLSGVYTIVVRAHTDSGDAVATVQITITAAAEGGAIARFNLYTAALIADPVRPRVYAADYREIVVLDARELTVLKRIPISETPSDLAISADNSKLLIATNSPRIERIDLENLSALPTLATSTSATHLCEGLNRRLYISGVDGGVGQIDAETGALQTIFYPPQPNGAQPPRVTIELSPDRKTLYTGELGGGTVGQLVRYDVSTANARLLQAIEVPTSANYTFLSVSGGGRYVTFTGPKTATIRSAADLNVIAGTFELPSNFLGPVAFTNDDSLAFISTRQREMPLTELVGVFDLRTGQQQQTIVLPRGMGMSRLVVDSTGEYLFIYTGSVALTDQLPTLDVYRVKPAAAPVPLPKRLLNVSTRMRSEPGDQALIGGFIVTGSVPKKVALRAIGPSLPVEGRLADPMLDLYDAAGHIVASNQNWNSHRATVLLSGLPPGEEREAVVVETLAPGSYTAVITDEGGASGVCLVEVYDLSSDEPAHLANISTRGKVETGDNVMIGGFIVGGDQPTRVIVRAIGPSLSANGVPGALGDPTLELFDGNGTSVALNDDWRSDQPEEIARTTIPPSDDLESAVVRTLQPGSYTAIVRGKEDTTGVALVEVYNLEPN